MKRENKLKDLFGELPYRTLVKEIKDFAIFHLDSEGRVLSWNEGAEIVFGYAADEVISQHFSIIFTPEDRDSGVPARELKKAEQVGRAEDIRWHLRKNNSRFYASGVTTALRDETGALIGFAKVARDRTARKLAEDNLIESETFGRSVFDSSTDSIKVLDLDGRLLSINAASQREMEIDEFGVFEKRFWTDFWDGEEHGEALAAIETAKQGDTHHFSGSRRTVKGNLKYWDVIVSPILDAAGNPKQLLTVSRDITGQKLIEEQRKRLLAAEQQARRTAEENNKIRDEFLATLSHELRTPLNAILGWSNLLRSGRLNARESARALETVERNARAQVQLIEDLLDISRIITGKLRLEVCPVELPAIIEAAVDVVRPAAEAKNIRLQTLLDTATGAISGDADRLQQVVWNLLTNAVKFTPKDGRVQIRLERFNSHVELIVADTGKGIAPEFLPSVFDRFRQADQTSTRRQGGLGLGLSIVRQIVEMHGGMVQVESEGEGKGASFVVKLPRLIPVPGTEINGEERIHPTASKQLASLDCAPKLKNLRILVVDDEADSRELLREILEHCGSIVATTGSAADALTAIEQQPPDILISDIGMPDQDGYSLISKVRALSKEKGGRIPAIALTAYARVEDRVRALRAGFQVYVSKPVEPLELAAVVASLAGRTGKV